MVTSSGLELLAYAQAALDGKVSIPAIRATRAAAVLGRQSIEAVVEEESSYISTDLKSATMRSKLIILQQLGDPDQAALITRAWNGLSQACHHHAYELHPTDSEVRQLLSIVAEVVVPSSTR